MLDFLCVIPLCFSPDKLYNEVHQTTTTFSLFNKIKNLNYVFQSESDHLRVSH